MHCNSQFALFHCILLPFPPFLPLTLLLPLSSSSPYLTQELSLLVCLICVLLSLSCCRNHSLMRMMRYSLKGDYEVFLLLFTAIQLISPTISPSSIFLSTLFDSPVYHLIHFLYLCALLFSSLLHLSYSCRLLQVRDRAAILLKAFATHTDEADLKCFFDEPMPM